MSRPPLTGTLAHLLGSNSRACVVRRLFKEPGGPPVRFAELGAASHLGMGGLARELDWLRRHRAVRRAVESPVVGYLPREGSDLAVALTMLVAAAERCDQAIPRPVTSLQDPTRVIRHRFQSTVP